MPGIQFFVNRAVSEKASQNQRLFLHGYIMSYGIMFWGNSSHSPIIFKMQKRVLRILVGIGYRDSCRELFKGLKILTLSSQYIFSLLLFVIQNRGHFASNSAFHDINTRQKNDLHLPHVSLIMYQKGVLYSGIKVFNALPTTIKDISSNPEKFKVTVKHYLLSHLFYSLH
jgi:type IV secretory pathway VirB3-like protein